MARLTKSDIERKLLTGASVAWQGANKKSSQLILDDPKKRRLFAFLLGSKAREATNLSDDFVVGLSLAYNGTDDPAATITTGSTFTSTAGPWRLQSIETEGFGGLNIWGGLSFNFDFDQESLLVEGPNGSGKSSLIGAILWALSGERPRDQATSLAHEPKPVFAEDDKPAGDWPPIACYPPEIAELKSPPRVRVKLTFQDTTGKSATVERTLDGGKVTVNADPSFDVPSILLEAGLLMPARLALLRIDGGRGQLTDAVQTLTGLDDLAAISGLVDGLCHKSREYLSFKRKDLTAAKKEFDQAITAARDGLAAVQETVPDFTPGHTNDDKGAMAAFGKKLTDRAAELTQVVSNDLAGNLKLESPAIQHQVITAIGSARDDLKAGLDGLPSWKSLTAIGLELNDEAAKRVSASIGAARQKSKEAVDLLEKIAKDSKFQLKAVAAQWHTKHKSGAVENCPLCEHDLKTNLSLTEELETLRSAGDAAARAFDDNLNAILAELETSVPVSLKHFGLEILAWEPRAKLAGDLRATFVIKDRYATILVKFGALVEAALAEIPAVELPPIPVPTGQEVLKVLNERIGVLEQLLNVAEWFHAHSNLWTEWWQKLATENATRDADVGLTGEGQDGKTIGEKASERLTTHLSRLSDALAKAEPYRKGAEAMRAAWKSGKSAAEIEKELNRREAIADSLAPLKTLGPFAESIAREAIQGLSGRIADLLKRLHRSEHLQFHDARLDRKEGLIVRGAVVPKLRIDATLVAN